ncbi:MAG: hypothetical protein OEN01_14360 [Candidatus Krumholzibacteria bacterium]|nr:hypothetical protein [Candidatus Krumholzibacteria bacterium]
MRRLYLLLLVVVVWASGCSSDPDTPLGSGLVDGGLIESRPGDVFEDTVNVVVGDATFTSTAFYAQFLTTPGQMIIGRKDDFKTTMLIRFDFSGGDDVGKTVTEAQLTLPAAPDTQSATLSARFYELLDTLNAGDTITSLDTASTPIPDDTLAVDRVMRAFPRIYQLPPALVQGWIGGLHHNGIAIVLTDNTTNKQLTFATKENSDNPFLKVFFSDTTDTSYRPLVTGTFAEDLSPLTSDLRISDGDTRRIFLPVDLGSLDDRALLHDASLVLRVAPSSSTGGDADIELYAPTDSTDIMDLGKRTPVTVAILGSAADRIEFPIRNIITQFLADPKTNLGFVVRYFPEGNSIRRVEFFGSSAADSLRPSMRFTFSDPPTFPKR